MTRMSPRRKRSRERFTASRMMSGMESPGRMSPMPGIGMAETTGISARSMYQEKPPMVVARQLAAAGSWLGIGAPTDGLLPWQTTGGALEVFHAVGDVGTEIQRKGGKKGHYHDR